jgi:hypothetical protein
MFVRTAGPSNRPAYFFVLHFVVDAVVVVDAVARVKQGLRFGDILVQQR